MVKRLLYVVMSQPTRSDQVVQDVEMEDDTNEFFYEGSSVLQSTLVSCFLVHFEPLTLQVKGTGKGTDIAVHEGISLLQEITCHMGSHSVACHPLVATFLSFPQLKLVLDLATQEGCKAELTWVVVISQDNLPAKFSHLSQKYSAVSWLGLQPTTKIHKSNVLTTRRPLLLML